MKLHRIRGGNRYCGPSAVSALTGAPTHEVARIMRRISGRRAIMGVPTWLICEVLRERFGLGLRRCLAAKDGTTRVTVAKWLRGRKPGTYLLIASNHYSVVRVYKQGRRKLQEWADSCNKVPVPWEEFNTVRVGRRSRVTAAWEIGSRDDMRVQRLLDQRADLERRIARIDEKIREVRAR